MPSPTRQYAPYRPVPKRQLLRIYKEASIKRQLLDNAKGSVAPHIGDAIGFAGRIMLPDLKPVPKSEAIKMWASLQTHHREVIVTGCGKHQNFLPREPSHPPPSHLLRQRDDVQFRKVKRRKVRKVKIRKRRELDSSPRVAVTTNGFHVNTYAD